MKLELFMGSTCPYCRMVKQEIDAEGRTDVEYLNIEQNSEYADRLLTVGGKRQIPCLFIDGKPLYESRDIIQWLKENPPA